MLQPNTIAETFTYNHTQLDGLLRNIILEQLSPDAAQWLLEKASAINEPKSSALAVAFAAMPRKVGKAPLVLPHPALEQLTALRPGLVLHNWTMDRFCRVWLLLQLDATEKETYVRRIEQLFPAAEMNELAALYSALPLLAYPEAWRSRCAEGIRSNIGLVLEAIICNNPYPAEQLPEGAWNQLVMKAFFTEKRVDQIVGLDARANEELAHMLLDFAHERWAAGRQAPPLLWRCVAPFFSQQNLSDVERALFSENSTDRDGAALACAQTPFAPAKALLEKRQEQKAAIESGALNWTSLAEQIA
jgi:hypothetical protein